MKPLPIVVLLAASFLHAQTGPGDRFLGGGPSGPKSSADAGASPQTPQVLQRVLFDQADGAVWAVSDTWKAEFTAAGATFVPFLGSDAPRNLPVQFRLRNATVGGQALRLTSGLPEQVDGSVVIPHGSVREEYATSVAGIEQRFACATLPQRGAVTVDIGVDGEFEVRAEGGGFVFENALGSFRYGRAVALDAAGRRVDLVTQWNGSGFSITVPGSFVEAATLPLVIDPLIGNVTTVNSSTYRLESTDVAYDQSMARYAVCWERIFSSTDSDVFVQYMDNVMQPVGTPVVVDVTGTSWRKCSIAGASLADRFLVVAEGGLAAPGPTFIAGRLLDGVTTTSAQFDIQNSATPASNPDVGGDAGTAAPVYFTVVFEQHTTAGNHDIAMRQVDVTGVLVGSQPITVANTAQTEHSPAISKSNGQDSFATQRWAIVYRRDLGLQGQTRAAMCAWNGQLTQFSGVPNFPISQFAAPTGPMQLAVSSPTDEQLGRFFMAAYLGIDAVTQKTVVMGAAISSQGSLISSGQGLTNTLVNCYAPSLDCDGFRFVLTYGQEFSAQPLDIDLFATTYSLVGNQLQQHDFSYITNSWDNEHAAAVTARHSGGTTTLRDYGIVWTRDLSTGSRIDAQNYQGMGATGGASIRNIGCGSLSVTGTGWGDLGSPYTMTLGGTQGFAGWVAGWPVTVPLPFCPGCTQGSTADVVVGSPVAVFGIPPNGSLFGLTLAFQGFDFSAGTCLGSLALSSVIDVTLR